MPLAPLTTFRVGGPADWLVETRSAEEIVAGAAGSRTRAGVAGDDARRRIERARVGRGRPRPGDSAARRRRSQRSTPTRVRADAAVTINGLVRWTINHGCAGLEAWAGTPGTVGGAIFGNAHFGGRLIGDLVDERPRRVATGERRADLPAAAMAFGYDRSRLQETGEVLLSAVFRVGAGEPAALRAVARESLAFRKRTQPLDTPSAGCVFQNPGPGRATSCRTGIPWSAGALVDRAGLKGAAIGGARVSPAHGNFIVNDGGATRARHPRADRALPRRGARAVRRRAARRDRVPWRLRRC